ncbi:MAG TPA: type II toxin-antitoxin system PemK/MazF family toxin [Candidatus Moranbacteria bacterium]|nr:type II toxin-antitoxin system PemK/MazF family toxin [Candidatus Moranbacteria bacterium]
MDYKRGDIILVNFNPWRQKEEVGKIRPAIIISDTIYNQESDLLIVIPMTTNLIDNAGALRVRIDKREKLEKESDAMIEQIRCISKNRVIEKIGGLKKEEIKLIKKGLKLILDLE